jgi:hypothetical protein
VSGGPGMVSPVCQRPADGAQDVGAFLTAEIAKMHTIRAGGLAGFMFQLVIGWQQVFVVNDRLQLDLFTRRKLERPFKSTGSAMGPPRGGPAVLFLYLSAETREARTICHPPSKLPAAARDVS